MTKSRRAPGRASAPLWIIWALCGVVIAACGDDESNCDPSSLLSYCLGNGASCDDNGDCASGYCGKELLPYDVSPGERVCRERSACKLAGCDRCALLGELGRNDGPMDQPVCVDPCFGDQLACSVCGCPTLNVCDPTTDRCVTPPPQFTQGSACKQDADCQSGYCRVSNQPDAAAERVCADRNEMQCDSVNAPCWGGTCWDSQSYLHPVCLASCESNADCTSLSGASFACVARAHGTGFECRLTCDSNNCGGITGNPGSCSTGTLKEGGAVQLCPSELTSAF